MYTVLLIVGYCGIRDRRVDCRCVIQGETEDEKGNENVRRKIDRYELIERKVVGSG